MVPPALPPAGCAGLPEPTPTNQSQLQAMPVGGSRSGGGWPKPKLFVAFIERFGLSAAESSLEYDAL
jgi:hypothetical protein